jgi:hypothetical protein
MAITVTPAPTSMPTYTPSTTIAIPATAVADTTPVRPTDTPTPQTVTEPTLNPGSLAQELARQGQRIYEENPRLGLRLALEAWWLLPDEDEAARSAILSLIQELAGQARLLKVGENVGRLVPNPDETSILIFPEGGQGLFPGQELAAELVLPQFV